MNTDKLDFRQIMFFIILSATVALGYQMPYLRFTFYDQMMVALQLNNAQMGIMASTLGLTCTICYPIGGFVANKLSVRTCMLTTLAAVSLLSVWFAFTTNFIMVIIIQILYGFFTTVTLWSAYLVGMRSIGSERIQGKLFGFSEATRGIMQTLCGFLFLAIMGAAASEVLGYRFVMLSGAGVCAIFFVLGFIFLPKKIATSKADENEKEKYTVMDILKSKGVWIVTLLIIGAYGSWSLGNSYLTTYTVQVLGISPELASTLGIIRSYVIVFLAGFFGGWLMDKFTYKGKAFILLLGIVIVALLAVIFTNKVPAVCIGLTLLIAFLANVMKSTYWSTMGQANIPTKMTALATGLISFLCFLPADSIAPMFCGKWIDAAAAAGNVAAGFNKIFILLICFSLIGIIAAIMLIKTKKEMDIKKVAELNEENA